MTQGGILASKQSTAKRFPTVAEQKRNGFDSLRLLFAVLVILSHSFPLTLGSNATEPLARLAATPLLPLDEMTLGSIAVWAFFIISGFLITKSWQRSNSAWSYLKKRFQRIYPGFIVAVSVCALIQAVFADAGKFPLPGFANFVIHTVRLQIFDNLPIFRGNPAPDVLNGSLWSVQYEFWCYIGILVLGVCGLLKNSRWLLSIFVVVVACHAWIDYRRWLPGGMLLGQIFGYPLFWTRVLPFFLAGMYFALNENKVELRRSYAIASAICLILATPFPYLPYIVYPICGAYLLMYMAYWAPVVNLNLGRWGDFSYGTYLYAFPVQQLIIYAAKGRIAPLTLFALATPVSIGLGALSWFFVERRFLPRSTKKRHEQSSDRPRIETGSSEQAARVGTTL